MNDRLYVTTAIPFVNAEPHVGFAYELLLADVLARHARLRGRQVRLQSGTDDNSLKNVRAAEREGIPVQAFVSRNAAEYQRLAAALDISLDDFLRTSTDPRHAPGVHALWNACVHSGDVYRRTYRGLYCTGCEAFYAADERCTEHDSPLEIVEEDNWFFRLSRYEPAIRGAIESGRLRIEPAPRRNEILALLGRGLEDVSISRSRARARGWGIPVPGDPDQITYVWFDALGNYVTALDWAGGGEAYRQYWEKGAERVHVIGKGITRFHAVVWPAVLLSAGLPLPDVLLVHGYLTVNGRKIGKSLGGGVSPARLVERYGQDAVRYYLIAHFRCGDDGDFDEARLVGAHDAELADRIGNLVRRVTALVHKKRGGVVRAAGRPVGAAGPLLETAGPPIDEALRSQTEALPGEIDGAIARFEIHAALGAVGRLFVAANRYVDATAPWTLRGERLDAVLHRLVETARSGASELEPFAPRASRAILEQLGTGPHVPGGPVLFPKIGRPKDEAAP